VEFVIYASSETVENLIFFHDLDDIVQSIDGGISNSIAIFFGDIWNALFGELFCSIDDLPESGFHDGTRLDNHELIEHAVFVVGAQFIGWPSRYDEGLGQPRAWLQRLRICERCRPSSTSRERVVRLFGNLNDPGIDPWRIRMLKDRRAVVVGGTSGIGLATAIELSRSGAQVWLTGRTPEKTAAAAASIGDRATGCAVDARDAAKLEVFSRELESLITSLSLWAAAARLAPSKTSMRRRCEPVSITSFGRISTPSVLE